LDVLSKSFKSLTKDDSLAKDKEIVTDPSERTHFRRIRTGESTTAATSACCSSASDTSLVGDKKQPDKQDQPPAKRKLVIRSGEMAFEVDSFDAAHATIRRLIDATKGGQLDTVNSQQLANGKMKGEIVVRMPPEQLDSFVANLRKELEKTGILKGQDISSEDISKKYTDLESQLKSNRAMEERILHIIKEGKGPIADLIVAERQLGEYREKIEKMEGEIRYYNNRVALSTLRISLTEKSIRSAVGLTENEQVKAGLEVEEVDRARSELEKSIREAGGRILQSDLKQHAADAFNVLMVFEVPPDKADVLRDRLRQLGTLTRLEIERVQQVEGSGTAPHTAKVTRGDTKFFVNLFNTVNIEPRETVDLLVAAPDVRAAYQTLTDALRQIKTRVTSSQLSQNPEKNAGALAVDFRRLDEAKVQKAVAAAGEIVTRQTTRKAEGKDAQGKDYTDARLLYKIGIVAERTLTPRATVTLQLAAVDVRSAFQTLKAAVEKAHGYIGVAQLQEQDRRDITGKLDFQVRRAEEDALYATLAAAGDVLSRQAAVAESGDYLTDTRVAFKITLVSAAKAIAPRETVAIALQVADVPTTLAALTALVKEAGGRAYDADVRQQEVGASAKVVYDVPLSAADALVDKIKAHGQVRRQVVELKTDAPDGKLALARITVGLGTADLLIPQEEGFWAQVRHGLSVSLRGLSISAGWLIVGLLFVLPWIIVLWLVVLGIRKLWWRRGEEESAVASAAAAGGGAPGT
jgi:glycine cleavage system regulatory protein